MDKCFIFLREQVLKQLKQRRVSVKDLCGNVCFLNTLSIDKSITIFVKEERESLFKSPDIDSVFSLFLNQYWSYLSYHLLEKLIRDYEMKSLEKRLKEFKAVLRMFMAETPVSVYAAVQPIQYKRIPEGFKEFISIHQYSKDSPLECVEDIREAFSSEYKFEKYALILSNILPSSIEIVWLVPESVVQHVIEVTSTISKATFRKFMLLKLECNGETIYEDDLTSDVKAEAMPSNKVMTSIYNVTASTFIPGCMYMYI